MIANSSTWLPHAAATIFRRNMTVYMAFYIHMVLLGGKKLFTQALVAPGAGCRQGDPLGKIHNLVPDT